MFDGSRVLQLAPPLLPQHAQGRASRTTAAAGDQPFYLPSPRWRLSYSSIRRSRSSILSLVS